MSIQKQRVMSRSIVIDPIEERIQLKRYNHHQKSLSRIAHTSSVDSFVLKKDKYLDQIQKFKNSISQVKIKLNKKALENQSLVKHMMEIDQRKSSWKQKQKKLPEIHQKNRKQQELRKQNEKLVERIMKQRIPRSRQELLKPDLEHQHYLQNLRKIKAKPNPSSYLQIIR